MPASGLWDSNLSHMTLEEIVLKCQLHLLATYTHQQDQGSSHIEESSQKGTMRLFTPANTSPEGPGPWDRICSFGSSASGAPNFHGPNRFGRKGLLGTNSILYLTTELSFSFSISPTNLGSLLADPTCFPACLASSSNADAPANACQMLRMHQG